MAITAVLEAYAEELDEEEQGFADSVNKRKFDVNKDAGAINKSRNFDRAHDILVEQYFSGEQSTYDEVDFQRHFVLDRIDFNDVYDKLKDFPEFQ